MGWAGHSEGNSTVIIKPGQKEKKECKKNLGIVGGGREKQESFYHRDIKS